jgi:hypothetical protein
MGHCVNVCVYVCVYLCVAVSPDSRHCRWDVNLVCVCVCVCSALPLCQGGNAERII